ncbi:BTAD domain-containing putative transcriptional regulator [Streptomyces sp. L7]
MGGRHDGRPLDLGSPLQRAVLVRLLLAEGRQCGLDDLVDALWEEPPGNAVRSVQTYVYRIRLSLGEDRSRLETTQGGYRLDIPESAVDALRFERLVRDGEELRAAWRTGAALSAGDAALALWSGEPLSGIPGPYAQRHRRRFAELRLNAQVARLGCADELGEHTRVATELIPLIDDHPLREDLYALRMRALHRAGRPAEALAVYAAARDAMVAELGMDPGPELRELQTRILAGTEPDPGEPGAAPDTDQVATAPADEAPAAVRPQQLPPAPGDFVGRERLGERLRLALRPSGEAVALTVLSGIGGVGETRARAALSRTASAATTRTASSMWTCGATAADPPIPRTVLVDFLLALGMPAAAIPSTPTARARGLPRTLTAGPADPGAPGQRVRHRPGGARCSRAHPATPR